MNYLETNRNFKDFLISILLILAIAVVIFNVVGVSEGASNKDTVNKGQISKIFSVKSIIISNNTEGGIKGAVNKSKSGTTIYLKKGVYKFNNTNIMINKTLTIVGKGSANYVVIDLRDMGRIFNIHKQGKLKLINVTIKNGKALSYGGTIYNKGYLSVNNCIFFKNKAVKKTNANDSYGGAISNVGSLNLKNSIFKNCSATAGGSIYCDAKYPTYVSSCKFIDTGDREEDAIYNNFDLYGSKIIAKNSSFKNCGLYNMVNNSLIAHNKFIISYYQAIANEGDHVRISNNIIIVEGTWEDITNGIYIIFSDYNKVFNNKIYGSFYEGIYIVGMKNKVLNNKIYGKTHSSGITLCFDYNSNLKKYEFSKYNTVSKNKISKCYYGIYV